MSINKNNLHYYDSNKPFAPSNVKLTRGIRRNWEKHQFHLVANSQLPILMSISTLLVVLSIVFYWHPSEIETVVWIDYMIMHIAFIMFTLTLLSWFIMVVRESQAGHHTAVVQQGLRLGFVLFIASEIMFFFAFFWAYFHYSVSPSIFIGYVWPPKGTQPLDPWGLPLTNTLLLLSSGVTITFAHRAIVTAQTSYQHLAFMKYLLATIILGITFLACQFIEYKYGITFSWKENVYGSIFFLLTGFHGFHVTFGTMFLWFCLVRALISRAGYFARPLINYFINRYNNKITKKKENLDTTSSALFKTLHDWAKQNSTAQWIHNMAVKMRTEKQTESKTPQNNLTQKTISKEEIEYFYIWLMTFGFTPKQHIGFETAAWYWHFVDVVWLFLYVVVYLW